MIQEKLHLYWRRYPWAVALATYICVSIGLFWSVLFGSHALKTYNAWPKGPLSFIDPVAGGPISYPMERMIAFAWSHLELPLVMPTQAFGINLAGNQGVAWFVPEILLHLLFPGNYSVWDVARLVLLAQGTYLLARQLKLSPMAAVLSGFFVAFSGAAPSNQNLGMVNPFVVMPYLLLAIRKLLASQTVRETLLSACLTALAVDLAFLSGFDEILPLIFLTAAVCVIASVVFAGARERQQLFVQVGWLALSGIAGVLFSAIATYSLLVPLRTYFDYQSPGSYLGHVSPLWNITLLNPQFAGPGVNAQPFSMGQIVWIVGNPVLWVLAVYGVVKLFGFGVRRQHVDPWNWGFLVISIFGILGYSDAGNVLNVFALPPFDLINMSRFIGFMWWLPISLLAGYGLDQLDTFPRWSRLVVPAGLVVADLAVMRVMQQNLHPGLSNLLLWNVPFVLIMFAFAMASRAWSGQKQGVVVTVIAVGALLFYYPDNFFSSTQSYASAAPTLRALQPNPLVYYVGSYDLPTLLSGVGISTPQAFGVFYPQGYYDLLSQLFHDSEITSASSIFYAGSPTLFSLNPSVHNLQLLRFLGVNEVVSRYPLPFSRDFPFVVSDAFYQNLSAVVPAPVLRAALLALQETYNAQPNLQSTQLWSSPTFTAGFLNWAVTNTDKPLSTVYAKILQAYNASGSEVPLFRLNPRRPTVGIPFTLSRILSLSGGHGSYYVYTAAHSSFPVWVPKQMRIVSPSAMLATFARTSAKGLEETALVTAPTDGGVGKVERSQPMLHVKVLRYQQGTEAQDIKLASTQNGFIVLQLTDTPGAVVTENHVPVPVTQVDGEFIGLSIHKGITDIRIRYLSSTLWGAWLLSFVGFVGLLVASVYLGLRARNNARL